MRYIILVVRKYPKISGRTRTTAKVFWSGRSQAVRLPREFRFAVREVTIRRTKKGVLLEPLPIDIDPNGWPKSFWDLFDQPASDLDVGHRKQSHERPYPLGRKR
jgi:antitoxin VapB